MLKYIYIKLDVVQMSSYLCKTALTVTRETLLQTMQQWPTKKNEEAQNISWILQSVDEICTLI